MGEQELLAERFEQNRGHLRAVAYRMLGSLNEADDAVQEAWLRLSHSDANAIKNFGGWLTTVVARVCLDMLRSRTARREELLVDHVPEPNANSAQGIDPEQEALLADSVGLALMVVLETLAPDERLAFVLHDMFDLPFEEIASILGRSPDAARQLASRARRRVQGTRTVPSADLKRQREIVDAFLAAARRGDFDALLALLDPHVVLRTDRAVLPPGEPDEISGAPAVAKRAVVGGARAAQTAMVNGDVGVIVAPRGRILLVLRFTITNGKIVEIEAVGDAQRLRELDLSVL